MGFKKRGNPLLIVLKKSESERNAMLDACFSYDEIPRKDGHFAAGEALPRAQSAMTLRWTKGKVTVTDGPYAETKEQLGGILVLEAIRHRSYEHAPFQP